jgi:hypothetical protein
MGILETIRKKYAELEDLALAHQRDDVQSKYARSPACS